jgi:WS/DGAT/MGAT family acyltransferase
MQTLSALDALFLRVESPSLHMHIASVGIYEGPPPSQDAIRAAITGKLHLVPRYRQRIRFVPLEAGAPVWVDDPSFGLDYHLRFTALAPPGGEAELCTLAGRVFGQQLDRDRPLWEMWIAEGLADGRWAVIAKIHHCMADGVAGTDLMSVVLDTSPDATPEPASPWTPERAPGTARLLVNALGEGVSDGVEVGRDLVSAARHPMRTATDLVHMRRELGAVARQSPPTSLNGSVGANRRWQPVRGTLAETKAIGEWFGATVNDVVLAAITTGFRDLLTARGEDVTQTVVRTLVPVSVRSTGERGALDNRVSGVFPELPVGVEDPVDRLLAIREQMEARKSAGEAGGGKTIMAIGELAPSVLLSFGEHQAAGLPQHFVQTVTTNVPGPRQTLYLAGRRLEEVFPFVPLGPSVRIGIAIMSYAGALNYGVTGDYDTATDIDVLCRGIERGIAELTRECKPARRSPRSRR